MAQPFNIPCNFTSKDPTVETFAIPPYNLRSPEQKQALNDQIKIFISLGIIEEEEATWFTALFVVPQKVDEDQKANDKNAQKWRIIQNFQPINAQVVTEEKALSLVEDVIAIAEDKKVFPIVDMS